MSPRDRLEVIYGPMFSGKTRELIRRLQEHDGAVAIKPVVDVRDDQSALIAHSGERFAAASVSSAEDLLNHARGTPVVGIDEAQFFGAYLLDVVGELQRDALVLVAGLNTDFLRRPFGIVPQLIDRADDAAELFAECGVCGRPARWTQRLRGREPATPAEPQVIVGSSELYEPRCDVCFVGV